MSKRTIERAAELIERHAQSLYDGCEGTTHPWACDNCEGHHPCQAERDYAEETDIAKALRSWQHGALVRLQSLLDDPHWGLSTWMEAVSRAGAEVKRLLEKAGIA